MAGLWQKAGNYTKRTSKDTLQLLKNTFALIGKNLDILQPTYRLFFWHGLLLVLLLVAIGCGVTGALLNSEFFLLLTYIFGGLYVVLLIFFLPFITTYYNAAQSWIVYSQLTGKKLTFKQGCKRAGENKGDIFWIGFITIIVGFVERYLTRRLGIIGSLIRFIVHESWDLLSHYLLPASIIEDDTSVWQSIKTLKNLKNNVPGTLVGVFGIDIVSGGIFGMFMIIPIFLLIGSILLAVFTGIWYFIPVVVLGLLVMGLIQTVLTGMVKTIYFSIFYTMVSKPQAVLPQYQEEMLHYLQFEEVRPVLDGANITSSRVSASSKTVSSASQDAMYQTLEPYFRDYVARGMTDEQVIAFLEKNGWNKDIVSARLALFHKK